MTTAKTEVEINSPWSDSQLESEAVSKKQIVEFLQTHASSEFLKVRKLNGKLENITRTNKKPDLILYYRELFSIKAFRNEEEENKKLAIQADVLPIGRKHNEQDSSKTRQISSSSSEQASKPSEKIGFRKEVLRNGDRKNFPKKGDIVSCRYKGSLENGTIFDQNMEKVKKQLPPPLKFKVGTGKVIRGWDEALLTMSVGEIAKITIESDWAYGKKGLSEAGIPPNAVLIFEVELLSID